MTRVDFLEFLRLHLDGILALEQKKAKEYDIDANNRFKHFDDIANDTNVPSHKVLNIMMQKHLKTIQENLKIDHMAKIDYGNWTERIDDAIVYLSLLKGMAYRACIEPIERED